MIEHKPWRGDAYCHTGVEGQRIAIVGYSHYWNLEFDHENVTRYCIQDLMKGVPNEEGQRWVTPLTSIRNYFGFEKHDDFWRRVIFFNYLPNSLSSDNRFGWGSKEQIDRARPRFLSILSQEKPDKVLIFTTKGWRDCPSTREEIGPPESAPLQLSACFPKFSWGTYELGSKRIMGFGLRHPQGANGRTMRRAVRHILDMPIG